nr:MAG TPA: hypothetical protein [Caudoviricetes sp.]
MSNGKLNVTASRWGFSRTDFRIFQSGGSPKCAASTARFSTAWQSTGSI